MSAQIKKLAILFADICGSTALYGKLGDQKARFLVAHCIFIMKNTLVAHNGTLVKIIGDEILCTFPTAESALNAACEMQRAVNTDNQSSEQPLYIRIGFNFGEVICEEGDIFGDSVNVASRVTDITRANQIMTTTAAVDVLPLSQQDRVRKILRADFKGKQEQLDIHQVMWELDNLCITRIGLSTFRKLNAGGNELVLTYRGQTYHLNDQNNILLLGRDDACQIIAKNEFASRQHANVEFRFDNFIFSDHSSNGTYIRSNDGLVARLNHEETILRGKGSISLGQPHLDNLSDLIKFEITPKS